MSAVYMSCVGRQLLQIWLISDTHVRVQHFHDNFLPSIFRASTDPGQFFPSLVFCPAWWRAVAYYASCFRLRIELIFQSWIFWPLFRLEMFLVLDRFKQDAAAMISAPLFRSQSITLVRVVDHTLPIHSLKEVGIAHQGPAIVFVT